ncbi:MAG: restriction endonuclease subunit M, partial [Anaerolineales bacterium]
LLGILNSALVTFYYRNRLITNRRSIAQLKKVHLDAIPIRTINFDDPADAARHDKMVALVERMLALHEKLAAATIPADKELYQRQIEATDRQIEGLVYELYGLAEEEIKIVEEVTQ